MERRDVESEGVARAFLRAMETGATAEEEMMSLFAENAVYLEPFSGRVQHHTGREAIRTVMRQGWKNPLPGIRIEVDSVAVAGAVVTAAWTCISPALPGGRASGTNTYTIQNGLITRLETTFASKQ